jgi:hypothetical protein
MNGSSTMNKEILSNKFGHIGRARSILNARNVFTAFFLSAFYHVFLLIVLPDRPNIQTPLFEFWQFVFSDIAIWTLGLLPLFALWRGQLAWYDPFFLFWMIIFGTFSTAFLAVCMDPFSAATWMSFGASNGFDPERGSFYSSLFEAEIIILIFMLILLLTNQRIIKYSSGTFTKKESSAALVTGIFFSILGIYGFVRFWGERSYLATVLSATGIFIPESGTARFVLLQGVASIAISLGLIGFLNITSQGQKKKGVSINWFVLE